MLTYQDEWIRNAYYNRTITRVKDAPAKDAKKIHMPVTNSEASTFKSAPVALHAQVYSDISIKFYTT